MVVNSLTKNTLATTLYNTIPKSNYRN